MLAFAQAMSIARSTRKSVETEWIRERFSTSTRPPPVLARPEIRQTATGFKMRRTSGDLERGTQVRDLAVGKA